MTREQIEEAAIEYADSIPQSDERKEYSREDFVSGAEYALSHQWIKVYESLPEEYKYVIVGDEYGHVEFAYIDAIGKWRGTRLFVFCWMPIPKFETKDKEDKL